MMNSIRWCAEVFIAVSEDIAISALSLETEN